MSSARKQLERITIEPFFEEQLREILEFYSHYRGTAQKRQELILRAIAEAHSQDKARNILAVFKGLPAMQEGERCVTHGTEWNDYCTLCISLRSRAALRRQILAELEGKDD